MVEDVSTARQPARMVWASIWMTPRGKLGRSPLVIMDRDSSAARNGYTARSYIQALEERQGPVQSWRVVYAGQRTYPHCKDLDRVAGVS
ncbi:hypothetical protein BKA66DRAFT_598773 [Pyrenochaeta sp. MPI-SDFR-AT-0127]|nr:hypothetical protein BKA66DRAFT_598773 [Pyrenochaeta sp. MPI-SDFR-AT-0127]